MSLIVVLIKPEMQEQSPLSFIVQKRVNAEQPWMSFQTLISFVA